MGKSRLPASVLLILWFLAWTASAAQPCCEALASMIPHHSDAAASESHATHQHGDQHSHHLANQAHQQCPQAKPLDLGAPGYRTPLLAHVAGRTVPLGNTDRASHVAIAASLRSSSTALTASFPVQAIVDLILPRVEPLGCVGFVSQSSSSNINVRRADARQGEVHESHRICEARRRGAGRGSLLHP